MAVPLPVAVGQTAGQPADRPMGPAAGVVQKYSQAVAPWVHSSLLQVVGNQKSVAGAVDGEIGRFDRVGLGEDSTAVEEPRLVG